MADRAPRLARKGTAATPSGTGCRQSFTGSLSLPPTSSGSPGLSRGESERPELLAQARLIAINALALRAIAAQRVAVVERLRNSSAVALAKGDNSLDLARVRSMQTWLARKEIDELSPQSSRRNTTMSSRAKSRQGAWELIVPGRIFSLLEWSDSIEHEQHAFEIAQKLVEQNERDDFAALEAAAIDLVRL